MSWFHGKYDLDTGLLKAGAGAEFGSKCSSFGCALPLCNIFAKESKVRYLQVTQTVIVTYYHNYVFYQINPKRVTQNNNYFPCSSIYRSAEYWLTYAGLALGLVPLTKASHTAKLGINRMRK